MDIVLKLPTKKYKESVESYKDNLLKNNSSTDGCGDLKKDDFYTWLKKSNDWRKGKNLPDGFVPATQYILVRKSDDKVIGMLQIRHELNEFLLNFGGNIGDSIAFDERGKGYGKRILELGLKKCRKMGFKKVLVTCLTTNIASKKCIIANGGKYENTKHLDGAGVDLERYWINLKEE